MNSHRVYCKLGVEDSEGIIYFLKKGRTKYISLRIHLLIASLFHSSSASEGARTHKDSHVAADGLFTETDISIDSRPCITIVNSAASRDVRARFMLQSVS